MEGYFKKVGFFCENPKMSKQISWEKRVVNFCERNVIRILQLLVCIHRIFGLTFGGLVIVSNGSHIKLSSNKYYKWYGCLITLAISCVDLWAFLSFELDPDKFSKHMGLEGFPKHIPIVITSVGILWSTTRLVVMYHNNIQGYKLAQLLHKGVDYQINSLIDIKVVVVPIIWTFFAVITVILPLISFPTRSIDDITVILEFIFGFISMSTNSSVIWMISMVHWNKLNQIKQLLESK